MTFDDIRNLAASDPAKADEYARTRHLAVRELVRGELGTLTGVSADGWALVTFPGADEPHAFSFTVLEPDDSGLVTLEMWELDEDGGESGPVRQLGVSTWALVRAQVAARNGQRRTYDLYDFPGAGGRTVRYRVTEVSE